MPVPTVVFGISISPWTLAGSSLAVAILLGWMLEKVLLARLRAWAASSAWKGDDIVVEAVRGLTFLWAIFFGVAIAAGQAPIDEDTAAVIHRILKGAFILTVTLAVSRAAAAAVDLYAERLGYVGRTTIATNLLRVVVLILGFLVLLQTEGISIAPVLTALGVGGLAVALALQDTLSNLFAGVHILLQRQVRPGDFVRLDEGTEGYVQDVGWRNTSIRTPVGNLVVIPNAKLAGMVVTNCTLPTPELNILVPVSVAYGLDLERIEAVTLAVARDLQAQHPGARATFEPVVRFRAFQDSGIELVTVLGAATPDDQPVLRHAFIKALHARYQTERIEIPYPTRVLKQVP